MSNGKWKIIRLPDPSLVLLIGPSGAGKSTFAAKHFYSTEIVSSDRCRAMICDDESEQGVTREAFGLLHHITRLRLAMRRLTIVDATNLKYRSRRPLLRIARRNRVEAVAIVFNISLETALTNNLTRSNRSVDEEAIRQHHKELPEAILRLNREGYRGVYMLDETNIGTVRVERVLL